MKTRRFPCLLTLGFILAAALVVAVCAPFAFADNFTDGTLSFTVSSGSIAAPSGSFIYDNTKHQFTSFTISWNGLGFDLVASSGTGGLDSINSLALQQAFWSSAPCAGASAAIANFNVLSNGGVCGPLTWMAENGNSESSFFLFGDPSNTLISDDNSGLTSPFSGTDSGKFSVFESTVPEPSTLILVLTAIVSVLLVRKHVSN